MLSPAKLRAQRPSITSEAPFGIEERALEPSAESVKDIDCAIAKVTDENPMAEGSEVAGRQRDTPGSIQEHSVLQAQQQVLRQYEDADRAQARSMIFIFRAGIALGERDDDVAADILNSEGNEIRREGRDIKALFS